MNLKESFRYQTFLDKLLDSTVNWLSRDSYVTRVKSNRYKSKAKPTEVDELDVDISLMRPFECSVDTLIDFAMFLVNEKELLTKAISKAKSSCEIDIDASVQNNVSVRNLAKKLSYMATIKSSESINRDSDYTFNVEGNQIVFSFPVTTVTKIDFNRENVRKLSKKLSKECDDISANVELAMLNTEVEYTPILDVNDRIEDALNDFISNKQGE